MVLHAFHTLDVSLDGMTSTAFPPLEISLGVPLDEKMLHAFHPLDVSLEVSLCKSLDLHRTYSVHWMNHTQVTVERCIIAQRVKAQEQAGLAADAGASRAITECQSTLVSTRLPTLNTISLLFCRRMYASVPLLCCYYSHLLRPATTLPQAGDWYDGQFGSYYLLP